MPKVPAVAVLALLATMLGGGRAMSAPEAAVVKDLRFDGQTNSLLLALDHAHPPLTTVAASGSSLVIDLYQTRFPFNELSAQVRHSPLVRTFAAAYDPEISGIHLVVEGRMPLKAEKVVRSDPPGVQLKLAPADNSAVATESSSVEQDVLAVPPAGSAIRHYRLVSGSEGDRLIELPPLPVPQRPRPSEPMQWNFPVPEIRVGYGNLSEQYQPEMISGAASGAVEVAVRWQPRFGPYAITGQLRRIGYQLGDDDYPGVTHTRTTTVLDFAGGLRYAWWGLSGESSLGYRAGFTQVVSSAAPPAPPAPSIFLFQSSQTVHGPVIQQTLGHSLFGPLGLECRLDWQPYVMTSVPNASLGTLDTVRVEPRLYLFESRMVTLGGYFEQTFGSAFQQQAYGGTLGVTLGGF
jgi:hypothetical protein